MKDINVNTKTQAKTRQRTREKVQSRAGLDSLSKNTIVIMGGVSALIGIWAAACFVSAMFGSGGPLELAQSWFKAITGM